ncbi:MAG: NfeD family protein [Lachnospiraceae bacterium]|nr:NfeD family protein [Lachnospiraceae bacterium]
MWIYIIVWFVIFVVMLVIELMTLGLTTIWFAGGALAAMISVFFKAPIWLQALDFVIVSLILLLLLRPFLSKFVNSRTQKTNVDSLIGKTARVTSPIDNLMGKGSAILNGQDWTARSLSDDQKIPEGTFVVVREIRGVKLIVEPKEGDTSELGRTAALKNVQ